MLFCCRLLEILLSLLRFPKHHPSILQAYLCSPKARKLHFKTKLNAVTILYEADLAPSAKYYSDTSIVGHAPFWILHCLFYFWNQHPNNPNNWSKDLNRLHFPEGWEQNQQCTFMSRAKQEHCHDGKNHCPRWKPSQHFAYHLHPP